MAFSLTLKRTFEEVIDVSCTTERPETMSFRIPVKRQKLQVTTPRELGLGYRDIISLEKSDCDEDFLCAVKQREDPDVPRLRLMTSPPGMMTSPPVRTYREIFPKEKLAANPTLNQPSFEEQFNARSQTCTELTRLALLGQPVVGSACLNLNIPDYQAAAAAAAALLSSSPLRANEVPESSDDRTGGFDGRTLLPQFFQHPSLRDFSMLKSGRYLWQKEESSTNTTCRNGFSDPRRLLGGSYTRRIGGNGLLGVRSRLNHRLNSESELVSAADEETTTGPVEVCAECQKVFKRKVYLQRHMEREHWLPAKVFKCDDCKYETKHQSNLSVHRRTHTGERPYHCGACGQRYTQGHLLKSHIRSRHAGNLRFYNLDKRSDSTRGRKSLDFKHDVCLTLSNKDVPCMDSVLSGPDANSIQSMQAFTYHRERFSSYMPRLSTPPLTNWNLPARSQTRREWPSDDSGSYFALGIIPQRAANNPPFLPPASGLSFMNRPVNMSTGLPVFPHDLTQLLSSDEKMAYHGDASSIYDSKDHLSHVVRLTGSMSSGNNQHRFANDALANVKDDDSDLLPERMTPPQSFPEDLTVTKKPEIYREDLRTPTPPVLGTVVAGCVPPDNSNTVDVEDDGGRPCTRHSLPTTEDMDETNPDATELREQIPEYDVCLKKPYQHLPYNYDFSTAQSGEPEDDCGEEEESLVREPEMIVRDDDEVPKDLSIARRSPFTDVRVSPDFAENQMKRTSCGDPDSDDNLSSVSASSSSDTSPPLKCRLRRIPTEQGTDGVPFDGAICPHFQKLQEFRRIVLRFVNAFAPNSLGINDKDESFAETDLIDEIVHAAMFNDVE